MAARRKAERPDMAAVLAMLKEQQKQNQLLMQKIMSTRGDKDEPVDLVAQGPAEGPAEDDLPRRRSPRLKNRAIKKEPQEDGTPLKRELSFEDAYSGGGRKRRKSKSPQLKLLRKKLAAKLAPYESDYMEGGLWSDEGGLQIGCVCMFVFTCIFVCLFAIHPLLFFVVCIFVGIFTAFAGQSSERSSGMTTATMRPRPRHSNYVNKLFAIGAHIY